MSWFPVWLRGTYIEQLRQAHVARWGFAPGDKVTVGWCGFCGASGHTGTVIRLSDPSARLARVHFDCPRGEGDVSTLYLRQS